MLHFRPSLGVHINPVDCPPTFTRLEDLPTMRHGGQDAATFATAANDQMIGARWLAAERGAFDVDLSPVIELLPDARIEPACAPLYEVAATHDGQPPVAWLQMFRGLWKA